MHSFTVGALFIAYGLMAVFTLFHVLQSLIAPPTPWLALCLEVGEERQNDSSASSAPQVVSHRTDLAPPPIRSNPPGDNAHA